MMTGSERERELMRLLFEIVQELGWFVAVPADQMSEMPDDLRGMFIGDEEWLEHILDNTVGGGRIANERIN